jgi:hypothetical protein
VEIVIRCGDRRVKPKGADPSTLLLGFKTVNRGCGAAQTVAAMNPAVGKGLAPSGYVPKACVNIHFAAASGLAALLQVGQSPTIMIRSEATLIVSPAGGTHHSERKRSTSQAQQHHVPQGAHHLHEVHCPSGKITAPRAVFGSRG